MKHAFHADYNVENGAKVFNRLATDAPTFNLLAFTFSSHPKSSDRFLRLEKIVEEFKAAYPSRFPLPPNADWEVVIPNMAGESLEQALSRLIESQTVSKPAVEEAKLATRNV